MAPWCLLGDWNEIRHNGEKDFNNMLDVLQLRELRSQGNSFTWGEKEGLIRFDLSSIDVLGTRSGSFFSLPQIRRSLT